MKRVSGATVSKIRVKIGFSVSKIVEQLGFYTTFVSLVAER